MNKNSIFTESPSCMFASKGIYCVNGKVHEVDIPTSKFSSNMFESAGPLWINSELFYEQTKQVEDLKTLVNRLAKQLGTELTTQEDLELMSTNVTIDPLFYWPETE